jgi:hypothetical protein
MKLRDTFAIALLFFISMSYGQEGFYYQAVIRNIDGSPMRNTPIQLKLSLLNSDTVLFEESHDLETNANGLIHTTLSSGEVVSGDWNSIDWSQTLSLKEEISRDGSIITQTIKSILKAPRAYIADKALALVPASIHAGHIVDQALSNDHIAENAQIAFNKLAISRENIEELGVSSGVQYTAGTNVSIDEDNVISVVDTDTTYSAGTNINIDEDHVISATDMDTTYSAGTNINIDEDNIISATDTDTTYSAGTNISIDGDNVISATDRDTNTTYALSFAGSTLTLTDSNGVATAIDLASLDTDTDTTYTAGTNVSIDDSGEISSIDTNTEYTAGTNVSIDANNVISSVDTNTTYSAGTNVTIDSDNVISAIDTDTNTTYALSFTGSTITLTDSNGVATDIDLASLNTDTDTTYTAGTNVSIDANNVISATDTDTTYSAGTGIEITAQTISVDNSVVTNNYQGAITANSFVGDGSSLTNITIPDDAITTSKIVDSSITSDKIDSSVDYTSSYSIANSTMTGANSGYVLSITNSSTTGNSSSNPLYIMGKGSITNWGPVEIEIPSTYTLTANSLVYITRSSLNFGPGGDASAILIGEIDTVNNKLTVSPSADTGTVATTFNFMIVNFDY